MGTLQAPIARDEEESHVATQAEEAKALVNGFVELQSFEPARRYLRVPCKGPGGSRSNNAEAIRKFMTETWGLKLPDFLLSIAGPSRDFDLDAKETEELMTGLVETAKATNAWFTTSGLHSGVSKFLGRARRLYADDITMIGFGSWNTVKGCSSFSSPKCQRESEVVVYSIACRLHTEKAGVQRLDPNHTHFILADSLSPGAVAAEVELRRAVEQVFQGVAQPRPTEQPPPDLQQANANTAASPIKDHSSRAGMLPRTSADPMSGMAEGASQSPSVRRTNTFSHTFSHTCSHRDQAAPILARTLSDTSVTPDAARRLGQNVRKKAREQKRAWIPCVCVSINGGGGTMRKVCGTVKAGTPVLLVEGSGKATDFMCEALAAYDEVASKSPEASRIAPHMRLGMWESARSLEQLKPLVKQREERIGIMRELLEQFDEKDAECPDKDVNFDKLEQTKIRTLFAEGHTIRFTGQGQNAARETLRMILCAIFQHRARFYVYQLGREKEGEEDLKGALLKCVLRCEDAKKEKEGDPLWLQNKIRIAVNWDKPAILREILRAGRDRGKSLQRYLSAVEIGVLEALCRGSEESLQELLEHGADLKGFGVTRAFLRKMQPGDKDVLKKGEVGPAQRGGGGGQGEAIGGGDKEGDDKPGEREEGDKTAAAGAADKARPELIKRCREAVLWEVMFRHCRQSQKAQHVRILIEDTKKQVKSDTKTILSYTDEQDKSGSPSPSQRRERQWVTFGTLDACRKTWKENLLDAETLLFNKMWMDGVDIDNGIMKVKNRELVMHYYNSVHWVLQMDLIYQGLLGEWWRFSTGILGKHWDLFLCMVLMNHHDVAKLVWQKIDRPLTAALVGCMMNKQMAKRPYIRQEVVVDMLESAGEFETMALEVVEQIRDESMQDALEMLETRHELLGGKTLFDLAVGCRADKFLVRCCSEVNDRRFFGDIEPHWTWLRLPGWLWAVFGSTVPLSGSLIAVKLLCDFDDDTPKPSTVEEWLWIALCCSIPLSLTLLAPVVLEFRLPPDSEYSRGPSQRRRIPRGYPYEPKKNQSLWFWKDEQKGEGNVIPQSLKNLEKWMDRERYKQLSLADRKKIWAPTFGYRERLRCFLAAPVTAHNLSATLYTGILLHFTATSTSGPVDYDVTALSEWLLFVYMLGWLTLQVTEMVWHRSTRFGGDNFTELSILFLFFTGWFGRSSPALGQLLASSWPGQVISPSSLAPPAQTIPVVQVCTPSSMSWVTVEMERWFHLPFSRLNCRDGQPAVKLEWPWQFYRLCNFLCWIRVLRIYSVDKNMGTLVRSLWLSLKDIVVFIVFWGVWLVAFASALNGGLKPELMKGEVEEENKSQHWWILQTYLQAFGEGGEVDHEDDYVAVVIAMTILLVLQLVLKDTVFTAVLTNKMRETQEGSQVEWLIDMYDTTNHFMEYSVPVPVNLFHHLLYNTVLSFFNAKKAATIRADEEASGLPVTSKGALLRHLRNSRFEGMHTIPREIEAELQRERQEWEEAEEMRKETGEVERGVCAGKSNDGGKKEQREEREEREEEHVRHLRDLATSQRHRALTGRAKARYEAKKQEELRRKNQIKTEEAALRVC